MSEEALQIAEKRREAKSKGERERYTQVNAKFQRIARRDKKAFLSEQCKEIEGNNKMEKTSNFFKKIRDTKGFPCSSVGNESTYNARDLGLIPGLGRSPGEGNGNPLQYSCLENPMDRARWAKVYGVAKSWIQLNN